MRVSVHVDFFGRRSDFEGVYNAIYGTYVPAVLVVTTSCTALYILKFIFFIIFLC